MDPHSPWSDCHNAPHNQEDEDPTALIAYMRGLLRGHLGKHGATDADGTTTTTQQQQQQQTSAIPYNPKPPFVDQTITLDDCYDCVMRKLIATDTDDEFKGGRCGIDPGPHGPYMGHHGPYMGGCCDTGCGCGSDMTRRQRRREKRKKSRHKQKDDNMYIKDSKGRTRAHFNVNSAKSQLSDALQDPNKRHDFVLKMVSFLFCCFLVSKEYFLRNYGIYIQQPFVFVVIVDHLNF